jgi:hypothetical protein
MVCLVCSPLGVSPLNPLPCGSDPRRAETEALPSETSSAQYAMARILVAASAQPRAILKRILAGYELVCAETMDEAERFLDRSSFALIICTIVFDDSRMFDFLRLAKSNAKWRKIPFICARVRRNTLSSEIALEAVGFTCRELGAVAFLDIGSFKSAPEREMRDAIEQFLPKEGDTAIQGAKRRQ